MSMARCALGLDTRGSQPARSGGGRPCARHSCPAAAADVQQPLDLVRRLGMELFGYASAARVDLGLRIRTAYVDPRSSGPSESERPRNSLTRVFSRIRKRAG